MKKSIDIDKNSLTPVYRQIVMKISAMIDAGELENGEMLPSMNELADEHEISKETVKKAYTILRDKGFVEPHQGKGFFVKKNGEAHKLKVLALFDKLSTYKQLLFDSMTERLDWENDIIQGLGDGLDTFRDYNRLNVITLPSSLYARPIRTGVERFCRDNGIRVTYSDVVIPENVSKGEAYLLLSGQYDFGLIELARLIKKKGLTVGKDIAIISYNESPISEIILNGLTTVSTDFIQMGRLIGDMILEKRLEKVHCNFRMTRRDSF